MATFDLTLGVRFTAGTAAADTFNLGAVRLTVLGLDGDDVFQESVVQALNYLDGGNGNYSFTLFSGSHDNYILGGDGNDSVFICVRRTKQHLRWRRQ